MIKKSLIIAALLLVGCGQQSTASQPISRITCKGTLVEQTKQAITVTCDDGRVFQYTSYKYPFYRNGTWMN